MRRDGVVVCGAIADIPAAAWNSLLTDKSTPFLRHQWLSALEASGCAGDRTGWSPRHLALYQQGRLLAAAPAYLRNDSDGDFSRDWDWASAFGRRGGYYPKLSLTVPFTPAGGERVLVAPGEDRRRRTAEIVQAAQALCREEGASSLQVLFPDEASARELEAAGLALRVSHQFHWRNEGYGTVEEFLSRFNSKRRHMLKRERAAPATQGIEIRTVRGDEIASDPRRWGKTAHALHRSTVDKLMWGRRWLDEDFYQRIFREMPEDLEVVVAERGGKVVAGAFNVVSKTRLFGRYWGCFEEHPFLHFNVCLYHSIDECIRRGIQVFEGGAGGEHKLPRGFLPALTWSAHWFADARADRAIRDALRTETPEREAAILRFLRQSPIFKQAS